MKESSRVVKDLFVSLIDSYLSGELTAEKFKTEYMSLWRTHRDSSESYEINKACDNALDRVFTLLDCFCSDESLRDERDLNEQQLRSEVMDIHAELLER